MAENGPKMTFLKCRDLRVLPGTNFLLPGTLNYSAPLAMSVKYWKEAAAAFDRMKKGLVLTLTMILDNLMAAILEVFCRL